MKIAEKFKDFAAVLFDLDGTLLDTLEKNEVRLLFATPRDLLAHFTGDAS